MNQTITNTMKVQCRWMPNVHLTEPKTCGFTDQLAVYSILISSFAEQLQTLKGLLNEQEILKSQNYVMEKDRNRFIVSRGVLKLILSKYLKKHPSDVSFYYEENLKPKVVSNGRPLHFNVSHSGDYILIAISNEPVGIDVEEIDKDFNYDQIFEITFSQKELDYIHNSHNRSEAFYLLWTRKEAFVKATGQGIDDCFSEIPSLTGSHELEGEVSDNTKTWQVGSFGLTTDTIASIAFQTDQIVGALRVYNLNPDYIAKALNA